MVTEKHVFQELDRIAIANGGEPPGVEKFESETGIERRHWQLAVGTPRWNEVLRKRGYSTKQFGETVIAAEVLLEKYAQFTRELGNSRRWMTYA